MTFRVGQKVVCIKQTDDMRTGEHDVVLNRVYTIRAIASFTGIEGVGFYLEEIINPVVGTCIGPVERAYYSHRFRPVVERKTSIEIFTKLLPPSPARSKELCGND